MSTTAETRAAERSQSGFRRGYERLVGIVDAAPIAVRVLAAIGVLALLVAAAFVVVLLAMSSLRDATDEQVRVNRVTAATLRLQGVVDDLDQSFRGFVLTRNRRIRESWNRARRQLGPATATLEKAVAEQPQQAALGRATVDLINDYVTLYGEPIISIAVESPAAAQQSVVATEGLTRIGQIRRGLADLLAREDRLASAHAAHAHKRSNQAVVIGVVALSASCLVLLLVLGYLIRSVAHPVRDVASGAAKIASGDFSIR
ncbi:MAG TPA: CHASE3 domain-containing protein, partial [Gaiellaceae bacterium]